MENSKICKHNCSQCSANQDVLVHGVDYRNDKKKKKTVIFCVYIHQVLFLIFTRV